MDKKLTIKEIENKLAGKDIEECLKILYSIRDTRQSFIKLLKKYEKIKNDLDEETDRFYGMCTYEREVYAKGYKLIAGVDEAGRGPLAGPVVAAAVILPQNVFIKGLDDSKKLTPHKREELYDEIIQKAEAWSTGLVDVEVIDKVNILEATKIAMETALRKLSPQPDFVLIDAVKLERANKNQKSIIKGDSKSISIAAASIVAKVTRDRILDKLSCLYPEYGFSEHKGYGTPQHIDAIKKYGICPIHRLSFTKKFIS